MLFYFPLRFTVLSLVSIHQRQSHQRPLQSGFSAVNIGLWILFRQTSLCTDSGLVGSLAIDVFRPLAGFREDRYLLRQDL